MKECGCGRLATLWLKTRTSPPPLPEGWSLPSLQDLQSAVRVAIDECQEKKMSVFEVKFNDELKKNKGR